MSEDLSAVSTSPGEFPEGGSFSEESSVLGENSPVTGPLGAALLLMYLTGMVGNIYTVVVASGRVVSCSAGSWGVYVINLALADLLYLSTIPSVVCTSFAHDWSFGGVGSQLLLSLDLLLSWHHACQHPPSDCHEPGEILGGVQTIVVAGLYQGEGLGIGPATHDYLNFSVTCLAHGNSSSTLFSTPCLLATTTSAPNTAE